MRKRLQNLILLLLFVFTAATAQEDSLVPEELGSVQATTKVEGKIYTFFADWVKIQKGNLHARAEYKRTGEVFLGATPGGQNLKVDAALYFGGGRVYLFVGERALAFDTDLSHKGIFLFNDIASQSLTRSFDLPPYWTHVDAAIRYDVHSILFFYGPGLMVYNLETKRTGQEFVIEHFKHTRLLGEVHIEAAFKDSGQHRIFFPKVKPGKEEIAVGK